MSYQQIIHKFESKHYRTIPKNAFLQVGNLIEVSVQIQEGDKFRIQKYRGVIIGRKNHPFNASITVRKLFQKIGMERIFPLQSAQLIDIKLIKTNFVRRAKLYYLRNAIGKNSLIKD